MTIISLVPHALHISLADGSIREIAPSGVVARVSTKEEIVGVVEGAEVTRIVFGEVEGLPPREEGKMFIVSRLVASAVPDRDDLLIPGPLVRDEKGVVIGARGFSVI